MNRDRRGLDVHKATVRRACRERSRQRDPPGRALLESSLEGRDIELSVSPKTSVPRPMISTRTAWIDDNLWRGPMVRIHFPPAVRPPQGALRGEQGRRPVANPRRSVLSPAPRILPCRRVAICLGQPATTSKVAQGLDLRSITAEGCSWNGL